MLTRDNRQTLQDGADVGMANTPGLDRSLQSWLHTHAHKRPNTQHATHKHTHEHNTQAPATHYTHAHRLVCNPRIYIHRHSYICVYICKSTMQYVSVEVDVKHIGEAIYLHMHICVYAETLVLEEAQTLM
jgi:hypothetical protein